MSTAIQRRGRPGLATLIEISPDPVSGAAGMAERTVALLSQLAKYQPDAGPERSAGNPLFRPGLRYRRGRG